MKQYVDKDNKFLIVEDNEENNLISNMYYTENNIIVSRRERNRRKKSSKLKGGKRYKKNTYSIGKIQAIPRFNIKDKKIYITAVLLTVMCISSHAYFKYHFYYGSSINGIDISGKTVKQADEYIQDIINDYSLTLNGRGNMTEVFNGKDFDLKYKSDIASEIKIMKENQNRSLWIKSLFRDERSDTSNMIITYDDKLLNDLIDKTIFFDEDKIFESENPKCVYINNKFEIQDEVYGTKVKTDILHEKIENAVLCGKDILNLDEEGCYDDPQYTKSSEKALKICNILNKYKDAKVKYNLGSKEELLDMSTMGSWVSIDDNYNETIDEDKVRQYVDEFADNYDTVGITRSMNSTKGRTVTVAGGDYGFKIDREGECTELIKNLESKQSVDREPIYEQRGFNTIANDIEKTCVEIDMTNQHLWFYKDGNIVTEGDIVTGCLANGTMTPEGTYKLKYRDKDAVLVGEGYSSPVTFWMPFNRNIGMHDASWRYNFGGKIYMTNGSHGCINMPYSLANDVFYNIEEGTPIICYY